MSTTPESNTLPRSIFMTSRVFDTTNEYEPLQAETIVTSSSGQTEAHVPVSVLEILDSVERCLGEDPTPRRRRFSHEIHYSSDSDSDSEVYEESTFGYELEPAHDMELKEGCFLTIAAFEALEAEAYAALSSGGEGGCSMARCKPSVISRQASDASDEDGVVDPDPDLRALCVINNAALEALNAEYYNADSEATSRHDSVTSRG